MKPNKAFNPAGTGTSSFAARWDDARITALGGVTPQSSPGAIKPTVNMTAIGATFADLAAARAATNTLATEAEARLDAIETKIDAIIAKLVTAGVLT